MEQPNLINTPPEVKPKKYFLCFGFKNFSVRDLEKFHVTLIYLGPEEGIGWKTKSPYKWKVEDLINLIDVYFMGSYDPWCPRVKSVGFEKEAMFGRNQDIRVLLPVYNNEHLERTFRKDLFNAITQAMPYTQESQFPFNPHLTTDLHFFRGEIDHLYLCSQGYEIHKAWSL